jgi:hypothetical protein
MSAFGGKADMVIAPQNVRLWTHSGHGQHHFAAMHTAHPKTEIAAIIRLKGVIA